MPLSKLKQVQEESDMHKRTLAFMEDENIRLKNRVSEVLKNSFNESLLNEIELFQGRFVREDELIRILRSYLLEVDQLLLLEVFEDGRVIKEAQKKLKKISIKMDSSHRRFSKLKADFNSFMSENS
jgi:hypothetical protein